MSLSAKFLDDHNSFLTNPKIGNCDTAKLSNIDFSCYSNEQNHNSENAKCSKLTK